MYVLACLGMFLIAYLINTTTISVLYHRGLAHGAVRLSPQARRFAATMGVWLTGLDPKGWVCMHRQHHEFSDTPRDPHSPVHLGGLGVLPGQQLRSYERTLVGLARAEPAYCRTVEDLDFPVSWINRRGVWYLPYLVHLAVALHGLGARKVAPLLAHEHVEPRLGELHIELPPRGDGGDRGCEGGFGCVTFAHGEVAHPCGVGARVVRRRERRRARRTFYRNVARGSASSRGVRRRGV